jgi:hypothetical protein
MSRFFAFLTISFLLCSFQTDIHAQKKITWDDLTDVEFKEEYVKKVDAYYLFPNFGPKVRDLDGKELIISGYMLVLDATGEFYVLSKGPFASCFFCGMAGPETIIEVQFKNKNHRRFKMDDRVTIKGRFKLNKNDIEHCNYIIEAAEEY